VLYRNSALCDLLLTRIQYSPSSQSRLFFQAGQDCMIVPSLKKEEAEKMFPGFKTATLPSGKSYIRTTPHPK